MPKAIKKALEETGLSYEVRPGRRHHRVFIQDVQVGVLSRGGKGRNDGGRGIQNTVAAIHRVARELKCTRS